MKQPRKVIAFCSDRPGIGQSMALASVAWLLATNGCRVVAIDWDLEEPSLLKYYAPFLAHDTLSLKPGLIDLVWEYALTARRASTRDLNDSRRCITEFTPHELDVPDDLRAQSTGVLHLISAGREPKRSLRVDYFSWREFFDILEGYSFLSTLFGYLSPQYDHILVDCPAHRRVNDATVFPLRKADVVIPCFTLDEESISATANLARWVTRQAVGREVSIYPVPSRVQHAEMELMTQAMDSARDAFAWLTAPPSAPGVPGDNYWWAMEVPEIPYYAFQRVLPPLIELDARFGATRVYNQLARAITGKAELEWRHASGEQRGKYMEEGRARVRPPNSARPAPVPFYGHSSYVFVSYARDDRDEVLPILQDLIEMEFRLWWDEEIPGGVDWHAHLTQRIQSCQFLLLFASKRSGQSQYVSEEIQLANRSNKPLLTIRLDLAALPVDLQYVLGRYQMLDVAAERFHEQLVRAMRFLDAPESAF
jgi:MinD-like ATPase involved in chromosome partitioning or flagellar assembly